MKKNSGFTLIELSMVLTVIGLVVAAVLSADSLINNARLKSLMAEVKEYQSSLRQFESSYGGLPGDINDASTYFSGVSDGNGNDQIEPETSDEAFEAISQLEAAGLISGSFTGLWGSGFVAQINNSTGNIPSSSSLEGAGIYVKCCSQTDYARDLLFNNHVSVFAISASDATRRVGVISPVDARAIDQKIDDANPDQGFVGASGSYNGSAYVSTGCYSGTGSSASYNTTTSDKDQPNCQMQFAYDWD